MSRASSSRPHHCFACGTLNTRGLGPDLHVEPGRSWTDVTLDRRFEGWDGIAHGGILCTILDEVMAWSLVGADNWGVTARMRVEFRKPVEIGRPIRAEGWIDRLAPARRRHRRAGSSTRGTGTVLADRDRRVRGGRRGPQARAPRSATASVPLGRDTASRAAILPTGDAAMTAAP